MSLIKPRTRRIPICRHVSRLQAPNRDVLVAYAAFIDESPDYVLNQLIETTLAKDRDFLAWRAGRGDQHDAAAGHEGDTDLAADTPHGRTR